MNILEIINNKLDPQTIWIVVAWVVTILAAGFIAQFGKRFADYLTDKIKTARTKRGEGAVDPSSQDTSYEAPSPQQTGKAEAPTAPGEKARLKREKKMAKALLKREKKKS